jgi:hypothetical protein
MMDDEIVAAVSSYERHSESDLDDITSGYDTDRMEDPDSQMLIRSQRIMPGMHDTSLYRTPMNVVLVSVRG